MKPVTYVTAHRIYENDWMVAQDFEKYGERFRLVAFGGTRREALGNLQIEIELADMSEQTDFDRFCCCLCGLLGVNSSVYFGE